MVSLLSRPVGPNDLEDVSLRAIWDRSSTSPEYRGDLPVVTGMTLSGEYQPSPQKWVREQVATIEGSGGTEGITLKGVPVVVVTSVGSRSRKLRKNPVMRIEHDGSYALVASKGGAPDHPSWFHNLVQHPVVELQDEGSRGDFEVRLTEGAERSEWWDRAVKVWPDYADYQKKTDREIPVFVAEPA